MRETPSPDEVAKQMLANAAVLDEDLLSFSPPTSRCQSCREALQAERRRSAQHPRAGIPLDEKRRAKDC